MTRFELTAWHGVKDNGKVMTVDEVIGEIANRWLQWVEGLQERTD